jgi:hypothetical protein
LATRRAYNAQVEPPEFVRRLAADPELARQASFALFSLTFLEQAGLLPAGTPAISGAAPDALIEALPAMVAAVSEKNPHLLAFFDDESRRTDLATIDPVAARDLAGWARSQRLEREEAQVAYELALLALGIELPPVIVRSLRQLDLSDETWVAELPDGAGYPTVFLQTLNPQWPAARRARLFVESTAARQLAAWAMLLLAKTLEPPARSIVPVSLSGQNAHGLLAEEEFDVALAYNPTRTLGGPAKWRERVRARRYVVV